MAFILTVFSGENALPDQLWLVGSFSSLRPEIQRHFLREASPDLLSSLTALITICKVICSLKSWLLNEPDLVYVSRKQLSINLDPLTHYPPQWIIPLLLLFLSNIKIPIQWSIYSLVSLTYMIWSYLALPAGACLRLERLHWTKRAK